MNRGEIYNAILDPPGKEPGREQTGYRPFLIVSSNQYNESQDLMVVGIPFTETPHTNLLPYTLEVSSTQTNGLSVDSVLLVLDLRSLGTNRIREKRGELESQILTQVLEMINIMI